MIIYLKKDTKESTIKEVEYSIKDRGCEIYKSENLGKINLGIVGNTNRLNTILNTFDINIEKVVNIDEPYKKANRLLKSEDTIIDIFRNKIGGNHFSVIAGPCSVESEEQIIKIAKDVKKSGATFLRGGAFKPRTSPYSFQGLGENGIELLKIASKETGLPIVSELMSSKYIDKFVEDVDIIQIGSRNMQNFDLLKEVGKTNKPILLKRGLSATIEEFLMAAEYIMSQGNENVILCERGVRTFEQYTRNTLDLSAIPIIKKHSHLPVVVDPSHAGGLWWLVEPLSKAAMAVGADGLMVEVHNDPANAKCDGDQSITPERFNSLMEKLRLMSKIEGKII